MLRRNFIQKSLFSLPLISSTSLYGFDENKSDFKIGLAQWSFHRAIRSRKMDNLDFAKTAKEKFDINVVEYVNQFFFNKAQDLSYLSEMKSRSHDIGVRNLLIMIDDEGSLGDSNKKRRIKAIDNHKKWVEAANYLDCDNIRVNAQGDGSEIEVAQFSSESLSVLAEFAKPYNINIIVENHGGYSSNAQWLIDVIKNSGEENVGTLPDFGNFCIKSKRNQLSDWGGLDGCAVEYDKYKGVEEMLPYARSVSAKSLNFDEDGNSIEIDFYKMIKIIKKFGYKDCISIEYEGTSHSESDGIRLTKNLLKKAWDSV
ncbi:MAG: TIM barrel protein [Bacteroidota bacterium]|nr:TIM barrel protein [Bacteroidota bacterium]